MILLFIIVCICCLQFTPFIWESGLYELFKNIVLILIISLLLYLTIVKRNNINNIFSVNFLKCYILSLFILSIEFLILFSIGAFLRVSPLYEFFLSFIFLVLGCMIKLSKENLSNLVRVYIFCVLILGISITISYSNGFNISDSYLPIPKNQIGPFFATSCLASLYMSNIERKKLKKYLYIALSILFFLFILILRARANMVATFIGVLTYIFFYQKSARQKIVFLILILVLIIFTPISDLVYKSFFSNYDVDSIDSVSSGRVDVYQFGLEFLNSHFFSGELFYGSVMTENTVHNYLLHKLVSYGTFYSLPFVFIYIYLICIYIYNSSKVKKQDDIYNIGVFLLIVPITVSLFEYTYPFGPGIPVLFSYICLGQFLINNKKNEFKKTLSN